MGVTKKRGTRGVRRKGKGKGKGKGTRRVRGREKRGSMRWLGKRVSDGLELYHPTLKRGSYSRNRRRDGIYRKVDRGLGRVGLLDDIL